jgi:outer membrane protein assembly factor BamB
MKTRLGYLAAVSALSLALPLHSADWPQWRGPDRNEISKEKGLLKTWPKQGPKLLWTFRDAGEGYSAPAIVGDTLYAMGAFDKDETLYALDVKKGERLWSTPIGSRLVNGYGDGPRSTPTDDGDFIFALGGNGDLACVERKSGNLIWKKSLRNNFGGKLMSGWGYSESPLVDGDQVVCCPGGDQGTVIALNKKTGATIWRTKDLKDSASYSSLVLATIGGVRQYVIMTDRHVSGIAAQDGKVLWSQNRQSNIAAIPTPIVKDNYVFVTSAYKAGCALYKILVDGGDFTATEVYADKGLKTMHNHHGGVVLIDNCLYGYSGTNDPKPRQWICQDFRTGKQIWAEDSKFEKGSLTYADGHLYLYGQDTGGVVLLKASPQGWKEDGRFTIPEETKVKRNRGLIWTHPVVANGCLYLRDQDLIFCYDIKGSDSANR